MAIKIQYNKTYLQQLNKELRVRENALPTLQAKESALRFEVKKAKEEARALERELAEATERAAGTFRLWTEFPAGIVSIRNVTLETRRIAGVKTPVLEKIDFVITDFSLVANPAWIPQGIEILKTAATLRIKRDLVTKKMAVLEYARKKTTQKVNLYEKVQIPEYREALLKIKRFLEDEDNLAKSSQKILKVRLAAAEVAA